MIEINNVLDIEKYLKDIKVVIFDLDDTLYSEKEYVYSGFKAACVEKYEELKRLFLEGKKPFDEVFGKDKDRYLKIYRNHFPSIHLYKGVIDMLNTLREDDKRLGIITDGRVEGQRNKIKALELENYFEKIVITDELGGVEYRKPNTKAFELMKEYFDVEYKDMVYIGDNLEKDFIAPIKLGMKTIYFNNEDSIRNLWSNKNATI